MGNLGVVIQARIWGLRYPGKVLADLGGETVLEHLIRRCKQIKGVSRTVVATPDIALLPIIQRYGATPYLGSEENVLKRFRDAAAAFDLDAVVRLTADCPFVDPGVVNDLIELWDSGEYDYVSNVLERSYPYGLDCEIISLRAMERILSVSQEKKHFEHVTLYVREHLEEFRTANLKTEEDYTRYDLRLDRPEDLPSLRAIYKCSGNALYPFVDMLKLCRRSRYGKHLRVLAGAGRQPGGNTETHGGHAEPTAHPADKPGAPWYERQPCQPHPGPESPTGGLLPNP